VVRWLLHEAERTPRKAFNSFSPFHCKLCDEPVPPREQRRHVTAHRRELDRLVEEIRRVAVKRLREVSRLRREVRR
jgi:transcription initiation factor IIE alpha subunit